MSLLRRRRAGDRPIRCRQVARRLQAYLDGAAGDVDADRVAAHLEHCRRCGLEAATYQEIKESLARRGQPVPAATLDRLRAFGDRLARGEVPPPAGGERPTR